MAIRHHIRIALVAFAALASAALLGCAPQGEPRGSYVCEHHSAHRAPDGQRFDADAQIRHTFGARTLKSEALVTLTFHFDAPFSFPSVTLTYKVTGEGVWTLTPDSILTADVDLDNVEVEYQSTTATNPNEVTMARELRRQMRRDKTQQDLRRFAEPAIRGAKLMRCDVEGLTLKPQNADTLVIMLKCQ